MNVREALKSLPLIEAGTVAGDSECVEGDEAGVHFILTKETWPMAGDIAAVFHLSLSGRRRNRRAFLRQFTRALGTPLSKAMKGPVQHIVWNASRGK